MLVSGKHFFSIKYELNCKSSRLWVEIKRKDRTKCGKHCLKMQNKLVVTILIFKIILFTLSLSVWWDSHENPKTALFNLVSYFSRKALWNAICLFSACPEMVSITFPFKLSSGGLFPLVQSDARYSTKMMLIVNGHLPAIYSKVSREIFFNTREKDWSGKTFFGEQLFHQSVFNLRKSIKSFDIHLKLKDFENHTAYCWRAQFILRSDCLLMV